MLRNGTEVVQCLFAKNVTSSLASLSGLEPRFKNECESGLLLPLFQECSWSAFPSISTRIKCCLFLQQLLVLCWLQPLHDSYLKLVINYYRIQHFFLAEETRIPVYLYSNYSIECYPAGVIQVVKNRGSFEAYLRLLVSVRTHHLVLAMNLLIVHLLLDLRNLTGMIFIGY